MKPKRFKDRTGDKEGLLTYVRYHNTLIVEANDRAYKYFAQWVCVCECGKEVIRIPKQKTTRTCGDSDCKLKLVLRSRVNAKNTKM